MGTSLAAVRADIAATITGAGVPAKSYVPERVTTPAAVVLPDTPYLDLTEGGSLNTQCGHITANYRVVVMGSRGTNEVTADELDDLIVQLVTALDLAYQVNTVAEPAEVEINGASFLGTVITVSVPTTIEELGE